MEQVLWLGLGLFGMIFLLHVALWQVFRPAADLSPLVKLFLGAPWLLAAVAWWLLPSLTWLDLVLAGFLYLALAAAYIQTYPGISSEIPSFQVLLALAASPQTAKELESVLSSATLVDSRLDKMLDDGFIAPDAEGGVRLLPKGKLLANLFYYYRRFLGRPEGKG